MDDFRHGSTDQKSVMHFLACWAIKKHIKLLAESNGDAMDTPVAGVRLLALLEMRPYNSRYTVVLN